MKKEEIIKNSISLMHEKGYNGTSVNDITKMAGIPKGSFYYYFKSKEDYVIEALSIYIYNLKSKSFEILKNKKLKPLDRIIKFYEYNINHLEANEFKKGCFVGNITEEMADVNNNIAYTVESIHNEISELICESLDESSEVKEKGTLNNKKLSNYIVNSWQGALLRMKASKAIEPLNTFLEMLKIILNKER